MNRVNSEQSSLLLNLCYPKLANTRLKFDI